MRQSRRKPAKGDIPVKRRRIAVVNDILQQIPNRERQNKRTQSVQARARHPPQRRPYPLKELNLDQRESATVPNGKVIIPHHRSHSNVTEQSPYLPVRRRQRAPVNAVASERIGSPELLIRAPLTEHNLHVHSKSAMASSKKYVSFSAPSSRSNSKCTTASNKFGERLKHKGIVFHPAKVIQPIDYETVQQHLNERRPSISPGNAHFQLYISDVENAGNEATMQNAAWPALSKREVNEPGYSGFWNHRWTQLKCDLTERISAARPDFSEAFVAEDYPQQTREALGGLLAPTEHDQGIPNLCVEWKGPEGSMESAEKQCAYDGALMVHAAHQIHKYMGRPIEDFENKTQALTVAANGRYVSYYSNQLVRCGNSYQYHQYPMGTDQPIASLRAFQDTCRRVRNCQDWSRSQAAKTLADLHAFENAAPDAEKMSSSISGGAHNGSFPHLLNGPTPQAPPQASPMKPARFSVGHGRVHKMTTRSRGGADVVGGLPL